MKLTTLFSNKFVQIFCVCLPLAAAALGFGSGTGQLSSDTNFELFNFSRSLSLGHGLLYPTAIGAITTYPLTALLLAPFSSNVDHLIVGTWIVGAFASVGGALALSTLTSRSWLVAIAYVLLSALSPSLMVLVMLAFSLIGMAAAQRNRWLWAGILMGFAILAEPSAIFPALLLALISVRYKGKFWRYVLVAALIPLGGISLLEFTLQISSGTPAILMIQIAPGIISVALPVLALWSMTRNWTTLREQPIRAVLVSWSAFTVLEALLHGAWPSLASIPGMLSLIASMSVRYWMILAVGVDLLLNIVLHGNQELGTERSIGAWIAANTPRESTLATANIGALAFYAQRPVIDMSGNLQSVPFDQDFFLRTAPDTITLDQAAVVLWDGFNTTYAPQFFLDDITIYRRVVNFTPLSPIQRADRVFSGNLVREDLRLDTFAAAESVKPGDLVRVRLDWQLAYAPIHEIDVTLGLFDTAGKRVALTFDKLAAEKWQAGSVSTYHSLVLPGDITEGTLKLKLSVSYANGDLGSQEIASLTVVKPPN